MELPVDSITTCDSPLLCCWYVNVFHCWMDLLPRWKFNVYICKQTFERKEWKRQNPPMTYQVRSPLRHGYLPWTSHWIVLTTPPRDGLSNGSWGRGGARCPTRDHIGQFTGRVAWRWVVFVWRVEVLCCGASTAGTLTVMSDIGFIADWRRCQTAAKCSEASKVRMKWICTYWSQKKNRKLIYNEWVML